MKALLGWLGQPTAVLAGDDTLASGDLRAASDLGRRVPDQVSVTGFGDIDLAAFTIPALTTVCQPVEELAHRCLQLLLDLIEGTNSQIAAPVIHLKPQLIIRDSCASPGYLG
jgi:DNA-binding LacI/PurR family transcriptional regulator